MNPLFYLTLFTLGAVDALQPGHAKSVVSSCLVGSNARVTHLIILGLMVTLTHIVVNGTLAYGIVTLASAVFDADYIRYVDLIGGIVILIVAAYLIWQRFFAKEKAACCGGHHHDHSHGVASSVKQPPKVLPFWQIVFLGMTSGLTPCPVVLTALISAISIGKGAEAFLGITIFSLGMGSVIFMVGLLTLLGLEKVRWFNQPDNIKLLSRLSAVGVLLIGGFLVVKSLFFYEMESESPISLFQSVASKP